MQFIYNENKEVIVEKTEENLKRLIRGSDLWASECTHEKTWYHYASDEQGSIVFIADDEEVKNRYEYDAFGNAVICEEKVENRYKYTGQQYDQITQQYYLRARYYNPVIARFTQEDAYRGDGLNLYAYCDNNSVIYSDPSGYCSNKDVNNKSYENGNIKRDENGRQWERKDENSPWVRKDENGRWRNEKGEFAKDPNRPDNPKPSVPDDNPSGSRGGRWGNAETRRQNKEIADELASRGYQVTYGGGRGSEEYLAGPNGVKGSNYSDITLTAPDGRTIRINTVDVDANGNITQREIDAANSINAKRPNDPPIILIPKGSGLGDLLKELERRGLPTEIPN